MSKLIANGDCNRITSHWYYLIGTTRWLQACPSWDGTIQISCSDFSYKPVQTRVSKVQYQEGRQTKQDCDKDIQYQDGNAGWYCIEYNEKEYDNQWKLCSQVSKECQWFLQRWLVIPNIQVISPMWMIWMHVLRSSSNVALVAAIAAFCRQAAVGIRNRVAILDICRTPSCILAVHALNHPE